MNLKKDISNRLWFMEYTKLKKLIKALLLFKKLVGNWMFLCRYACRKIHNRWLIWNWWDRKLLCRYNIEHHIPLSPKMYADSIVKMNIKISLSSLFPVYPSIYPYLYWYVCITIPNINFSFDIVGIIGYYDVVNVCVLQF